MVYVKYMLYKETCHWQCCCELWAACKVCYMSQAAWGDNIKHWGIVCRGTVSSDMFLPSLTFSGAPKNVGELVMCFLFFRPAGPRPAPCDAVETWASGYGQLLEMLLD